MKISVVIPVYNEEKHITQCIDALIHNTRRPDEILLEDLRIEPSCWHQNFQK